MSTDGAVEGRRGYLGRPTAAAGYADCFRRVAERILVSSDEGGAYAESPFNTFMTIRLGKQELGHLWSVPSGHRSDDEKGPSHWQAEGTGDGSQGAEVTPRRVSPRQLPGSHEVGD